jgi:hypothetical protein
LCYCYYLLALIFFHVGVLINKDAYNFKYLHSKEKICVK